MGRDYSEIPFENFSDRAKEVIRYAIDRAKRDNVMLTNAHILLGITKVEAGWFGFISKSLDLIPEEVQGQIEEYLRQKCQEVISISIWSNPKSFVSLKTKELWTNALAFARTFKRDFIEVSDLLLAIFKEEGNIGAEILYRHQLKQLDFHKKLFQIVENPNFLSEHLKKRYELPSFLKHFAVNLNLLACQDKIPPVFCRDREIQEVLEILCHVERPNSAILLGEPGVGKTAIVEGLARKMEYEPDKIPPRLRSCQIVSINMNTLVAGTILRGMFEERIQNVIREIKENPQLIIFIDEAQTMIGAGSALGAPSDAASVFKSVMGRGEIRIISATTLSEYKKHIQEDEALARRFRPVYIDEPSIEQTSLIIQSLLPRLERNYSVRITEDAVQTALALSPRYMRHLRRPDKTIGWLDTAAVKSEIALKKTVESQDVVRVISGVTKIPVDMVTRDVLASLKNIEESLSRRVIGQRQAIETVAGRLRLNKGPLKENFDSPDGVFLFLGPTGVGKTELAKALAEFLFGDEKKMIRIDMSEYQHDYDGVSVSKLIGMPRGITGSEEGGILTNQLKDDSYSVVLLDEFEKAGPRLLNLFLQAFDEGWITDGRGKRVYLSDAIVIMTSNLGSGDMRRLTNPPGFRRKENLSELSRQVKNEVMKELEINFSPEFINRLEEIIIFDHLSEEEVEKIARNFLLKLKETLEKDGKSLEVDDAVYPKIIEAGYSLTYGARHLKRTIENLINKPISAQLNSRRVFRVSVEDKEVVITGNGILINMSSLDPRSATV